MTYFTVYAPFTPNNSEQRSHPPYYRGCCTELAGASSKSTVKQHEYYPCCPSSLSTEIYNPKAFFTHAALLRQAFAHCAKFPTAASRRSLDRISVPVWLIILSDQLPIEALVSHYLTN